MLITVTAMRRFASMRKNLLTSYLKFSKKLRAPLLMARNRKLRPRAGPEEGRRPRRSSSTLTGGTAPALHAN